jgi:hypothetical protein
MSTIKRVRFNINNEYRKPIISKKRNIKPANLIPCRKLKCEVSAMKAYNIGIMTEQYLKKDLNPFEELYIIFILEQHYMRNRVQNNKKNEFIIFSRWLKIKNPEHETPSPEQFIKLLSRKSYIITHIS